MLLQAKGQLDLLALHDFVVKVTVFTKAMDASATLDDDVSELFSQYANALAEQGLLVTAAKYARYVSSVFFRTVCSSGSLPHTIHFSLLRGASLDSKVLRDRLYRSRESPGCLAAMGSAPEFPFSLVQVNKAPAGTTSSSSRSSQRGQQQSYPQQQAASRNAAASQTAYGAQQQVQQVRL